MDTIQIMFVLQIFIFCLNRNKPMVFFSFFAYWGYVLSNYIDPFSSTLLCTGTCLVTGYLLVQSKKKDTLLQLCILIFILPLLGVLLYDQIAEDNMIISVFKSIYLGVQVAQLLSIGESINGYINNLVFKLCSDNDYIRSLNIGKDDSKPC